MSGERPTPTVEDYLGVIYTLQRDGDVVIGRKLADWLEVSAPTVTATLQRMVRDGWVTMARDKSIHLTEMGHEAAASVVRRHMLTELLLARVLGIPWSRVHEEADRLEHGLSSETAAAVASMVEDSGLCPHGNPMPGHEALTQDLIPLLEGRLNRAYTLARVHEEVERDPELMEFLEKNCLVPGSIVNVVSIMPFNETVTVSTVAGQAVLGMNVARSLWIAPLGDDSPAP
jgi:DtxR family Mn-dependent transcriptional regulator